MIYGDHVAEERQDIFDLDQRTLLEETHSFLDVLVLGDHVFSWQYIF